MRLRFLLLLLALPLIVPSPGIAREQPGAATRTATVVDVQGSAWFRSATRERWSPLSLGDPLFPGDSVRTSQRGAHALEIRLAEGKEVVLGPGSLAELRDDGEVRLIRGEAAVTREGVEQILRAYPGGTRVLDVAPRWLTGYRNSTTEEWMGSLVAKVDGRNVPLTISTCNVSVVVRDQVAETTVDTSFRNNTSRELEGEFSFPLPAGASVSGFGMWVGGELIMADIVERGRARRIYEDIRRRKKDPGLLEWSGGNLFTARVYPIPGMSDKRVRIRFTQALPLRGKSYVYRYPLRSEMTLAHPLKRLSLRLVVHSADRLESVVCNSHEARAIRGDDWAGISYTDEGRTPASDFETVITLKEVRPVTVVTHQRGKDGYFMLLLSPPAPEAQDWERELTPEGDPLDLVLLADTSASMGRDDRGTQAAFLEALLSQLGPRDTFRLAACDVEVAWWKEEPVAATVENTEQALAFLDARYSLGWTDLDKSLLKVMDAAEKGTHLIYLGDGVGTTGDADAGALAARIRKLGGLKWPPTCHAVAVGSSFESAVLAAIASRGGGSVHEMAGDPAGTARALLSEITRPALRGIGVFFDDVRTAKVYPKDPPNLPAGSQLAILGRFAPSDSPQEGRVQVQGIVGDEMVRYSTPFTVKPGDPGNSFLPRLWARAHIDALLLEEQTPEIREEIVARSRAFNIMTPYTSLLVLENPEDRRRYGVERRVQMRDGEEFFAEAGDRAATEILRQQVRKGRLWRESLREAMEREISGLGRDLDHGGYGHPSGGFGFAGGAGSFLFGATRFDTYPLQNALASSELALSEEWGVAYEGGGAVERAFSESQGDPGTPFSDVELTEAEWDGEPRFSGEATIALDLYNYRSVALNYAGRGLSFNRRLLKRKVVFSDGEYAFGYGGPGSSHFLNLFPPLEAPGTPPDASPAPDWPLDVRTLLEKVARPDLMEKLEGGIETTRVARTFHALRGAVTQLSRDRGVLTKSGWYGLHVPRGHQPSERWCADGERGVLNPALRLGRKRAAVPTDHARGRYVPGITVWDLIDTYQSWNAAREDRPDGTAVVRITPKEDVDEEIRVVVDTTRMVVLSQETWRKGVREASVRYADFVEAGGYWWPRTIQWFDKEGRQTSRSDIEIRTVSADVAHARIAAARKEHEDALFLPGKDQEVRAARQAVFEGSATFADHLAVVFHYGATSRWGRMWKALEDAKRSAPGKPGLEWLKAGLLAASRRGEELAQHMTHLAGNLVAKPGRWSDWQAWHACDLVNHVLGPVEMMRLAGSMKTAWFQHEDRIWWGTRWALRHAGWLTRANRTREAEAPLVSLAKDAGEDSQVIRECLSHLQGEESLRAALAVARAGFQHEALWFPHEVDGVYDLLTDILWNANAHRTFLSVARRWEALRPDRAQTWERILAGLFEVDPGAAERWIQDRLTGELPGRDDKVGMAHLSAALQYALGQRWRGWARHLDMIWEKPLELLANRLLDGEEHQFNLAGTIISNWRYLRLDAGRRSLAALRGMLAGDSIEKLSNEKLSNIVRWLPWDRSGASDQLASRVTEELERRLFAEKDMQLRSNLAYAVSNILEAREDVDGVVALLRRRLEAADAADADDKSWLAEDLGNRLLGLPWTDAIEQEAFSLLPRVLPQDAEPAVRRSTYPSRLRQMVQELTRGRIRAAVGTQEEREKLTREELGTRRRTAKVEARDGLAHRLGEVAEKADAELLPWLRLERLCLLTEAGGEVEAEARALIAMADEGEEEDPLQSVLRERTVLALTLAATRSGAASGFFDRTQDFLRSRIAGTKDPYVEQVRVFRLLLAGSRPVLDTVRGFFGDSQVDSRWRVVLGHLLAERGEIREAVARFETAAALDELDTSGYSLLADLYLVLGEDDRRKEALRNRDAAADLDALWWVVRRAENRLWSEDEDGGPQKLEAGELEALRQLLSRSTDPDRSLGRLKSLYLQSKDHRILSALPDALLGHSPEHIYAVLKSVKEDLLDKVHEEAATDSVVEAITKRGMEAKRSVDLRALCLLTLLVERRAAEVLDQPDAHVAPAWKALGAALKDEWQAGEPRLYAEFLASLGAVKSSRFREEHLKQLEAVNRLEGQSPPDALEIAHALFRTLWAYGLHDRAASVIGEAFSRCKEENRGALPREAEGAAASLIHWLEERERFLEGEAWVVSEIAAGPEDPDWFQARLLHLYAKALAKKADSTLGEGGELYRSARAAALSSLLVIHRRHLPSAFEAFLALHEAFGKGAGEDLVAFSRGAFEEVIRRFPSDQRYRRMINLATALSSLVSHHAALTFYVERLEAEPDWRKRSREGCWYHWIRPMHQVFSKVKKLGDLEPRLLAVVLAELRHDLDSTEYSQRFFYGGNRKSLWKKNEGVFRKTALDFVAEHPHSPSRILHAAEYLAGGLNRMGEAVEILERAHGRGDLHVDGRYRLARMHMELKHWKPAASHLAALLEQSPGHSEYYPTAMRALHGAGRDEEGQAASDAAGTRFRGKEPWDAGFVYDLAEAALDSDYFARSKSLFEEELTLLRKHRGEAEEMSEAYVGLARSYSGLGLDDDAVDAASAAIVAWGDTVYGRREALETLRKVIQDIEDVDAWVARWEGEARQSGLDSGVVRHAIGDVYLGRKKPALALTHLKRARALSPEDEAIHESIVKCARTMKDFDTEVEAVVAWLHAATNEDAPLGKLASALAKKGRKAEAERVWTTFAELGPHEADGHRRLAKVRERQKRFEEAVVQWEQVVRTRDFDPEGWFGLAATLKKAGKPDRAKAILEKIATRSWAPEFGNPRKKARALLER